MTQQSPRVSRAARALLTGTVVVLSLSLLAGTALAGKPGGGGGKPGGGATGGGTLSLRLVTDANADGQPNYRDEITYVVSTTATSEPMVGLRCYQGAAFVHDGYIALYDASWLTKIFLLDSTSWNASASADCTARLFYYDSRGREKILATSAFVAAP